MAVSGTHAVAGRGAKLKRLAFLISGSAAHVFAVHGAIEAGELTGCALALVVCNIPGAAGAEEARAAGITTVTMEGRGREQRDHEDAIDALLRKMRVDIVCMSGYLRTLSTSMLGRWPDKVLNVHPSLLPAFPGRDAVAATLAFGSQISGATVFLVHDGLEMVVVEQQAAAVEQGDTQEMLATRLEAAGSMAYVAALKKMLGGEYVVDGRRYLRDGGE